MSIFALDNFNLLHFLLRKVKLIWFLLIPLPSTFYFILTFKTLCLSKDTTNVKQQNNFKLILHIEASVSCSDSVRIFYSVIFGGFSQDASERIGN